MALIMLIVIFDGGICQFEDMYFHAICACVVYDTHTTLQYSLLLLPR